MTKTRRQPSAPLVLIVDDDPDTREMYSMYLTAQRMRVLLAGDGATAIRTAVSSQPDVIVMDLSLPGIDGWDAIRWLKGYKRTAHIPVVALTGRFFGRSAESAIEAGCDTYLLKPCLPEHLSKEIRTVLARVSERREA
jgi:CheY-like chemotaxis protein